MFINVVCYSYDRILKEFQMHLSRWPSGLKAPVGKLRVAGLIPNGDIFILNFSLVSQSSQLGGAHANEIKHDHSPVVYLVVDPETIIYITAV